MEGSSRESAAAATDELNEYARGAAVADIVAVGEDLLNVASVLHREPGLRRALADPSRDGEARRGLAQSLFGDRISAAAGDQFGALVRGRWSATADLLDATELLGVEALLASAEKGGTLDDVEDALFRFRQVVAAEPELASALGDSTADAERQRELLRTLLTGKVDPLTERLAELAATRFGGRGFDAALLRLVELAAARRERQIAYVTVAAPLAEADEERLVSVLSRMYGRQVAVRLSVDPELIGGMRVRVGYDLYDGTVIRRLTDARSALVGRR